MEGHRLFGSFGVSLPYQLLNNKSGRVISTFQNWEYVSKLKDWVNVDTRQLMMNYIPCYKIIQIIENNLDSIEK